MSSHGAAPAHAPAAKTAVKEPSKLVIGLSGAFGAIIAILADIYLKDTACAIDSLDQKLHSILQVHLHPIGAMILLIAFGIGLCFVFPERTTPKAFFRGASVLTMLMTVTPYTGYPGIPRTPEEPQPSSKLHYLDSLFVQGVLAAETQSGNLFRLDVHLSPNDGKKIPGAVYTLTDPKTGAVLARSRISGNDASFYLLKRDYELRVEVSSYKIATLSIKLQAAQSITVSLQSSWVPLAFQRMAM